MRPDALAVTLLLPDRLPSLVVLVGFWLPPALAGWAVAGFLQRGTRRHLTVMAYAALAIFVLGYAAAWFYFNLGRMPPYIPGASTDPTFAPPEAVAGPATFASAIVLPGSAVACAAAFYGRARLRPGAEARRWSTLAGRRITAGLCRAGTGRRLQP